MTNITGILTLILGIGYLFAGSLLVGRWQIEPTQSVLLFGRRIGAVYIGLSVMCYFARSLPVSAGRTALCAGAATICTLEAVLGVYEFSVGRAGPGILISAVIEAFLALSYIRILYVERRIAVGG